ncbi:unnamed protein product, partial [Mesorhabditis belari]|uniref:Amino acid transporter transmembrane domain-containing protein n=1 Tax=Mesorhabditis belari TaxID=2138241 RepID=A0AAF3FKC1_9BILA
MLPKGSINSAKETIIIDEKDIGVDHGEKDFERDGSNSMIFREIQSENKLAHQGEINYLQTLVSLIKAMVGAGVLSLPYAFKQAGLWMGFSLMSLFGFISYFTFRKIVLCAHYLAKEHNFESLDYGWMAEKAFEKSLPPLRRFATPMRYAINTCIFGFQLGVCSSYVVFIKEHAKELVDYKSPSNSISPALYYVIEFGFVTLLVLVRSIRVISFVALAGNVFVSTALLAITQELVRSEHHVGSLPAVQGIGGMVLAAGAILYSFEGQAIILPLTNKMKKPKQMMGVFGVLSIGVGVVTFIYVGVGFLGYITYGDDTAASIGLNLPNYGIWFYVKLLLVLVVYTSYLIQQFVIVDMAWPFIKEKIENRNFFPRLLVLWEFLFKIFLNFISFLLAIVVPKLDDIIPLVGVTAGMLLALVIPSICHTVTFLPKWLKEKNYRWMMIHCSIDLTLFIAGWFFVIDGFITNLQNILKDVRDGEFKFG